MNSQPKSDSRPRGVLLLVLFPLLSGLAACSDSDPGPTTADTNPSVTRVVVHVISGADQAGSDGRVLDEPVVVQLTREDGTPEDSVPVRFAVIHGGGLVGDPEVWIPHRTLDVLTNSQGLAPAKWQLGSSPDHILKVSVPTDVNGTSTWYTGSSAYVFAGMEAKISIAWTEGYEFRVYDRVIPHDGRVLETPNYLTFSDAGTDDAKVVFAALAEESLHEIMKAYGMSSTTELGIDEADPTTKLTIYSNRTFQYDTVAYAFRWGFVAGGKDSGVYPSASEMRQVIKHELSHLFFMIVTWDDRIGYWLPDVWFSEGLAEHTAGGSRTPILTPEDVNTWRAKSDHINPIDIREWRNFPESVIDRSNGFEYYPMFDLAVRYLLDEAGRGRTDADVRAMCEDIKAGSGFHLAFEKHMGISVDEYEKQFYDLITRYLGG